MKNTTLKLISAALLAGGMFAMQAWAGDAASQAADPRKCQACVTEYDACLDSGQDYVICGQRYQACLRYWRCPIVLPEAQSPVQRQDLSEGG